MKLTKLCALMALISPFTLSAAPVYIGAGAGYLLDLEEAYFTSRFGFNVAQTDNVSHNMELEGGYATTTFAGSGLAGADDYRLTIVPVTLNYRYVLAVNDDLSAFLGGGLGSARLSLSQSGNSDREWKFAAQAIAGASYRMTSNFFLGATARYLYIDHDVPAALDFGNDDISIEVSASFVF